MRTEKTAVAIFLIVTAFLKISDEVNENDEKTCRTGCCGAYNVHLRSVCGRRKFLYRRLGAGACRSCDYEEINSVTLTKDLDMTGFEFGTCVINKLTGEFNGNGHTIKNLTLYGKANANTGLIAELTGSVAGLKLENINITDYISNGSVTWGTVAGLVPDGSQLLLQTA